MVVDPRGSPGWTVEFLNDDGREPARSWLESLDDPTKQSAVIAGVEHRARFGGARRLPDGMGEEPRRRALRAPDQTFGGGGPEDPLRGGSTITDSTTRSSDRAA